MKPVLPQSQLAPCQQRHRWRERLLPLVLLPAGQPSADYCFQFDVYAVLQSDRLAMSGWIARETTWAR